MNSHWNTRNDYEHLNKLQGAKIIKVDYEDQSPSVKQAIRSVPAIIILKDGRPIATWQADISMKLKLCYETVQEMINNAKAPASRASTN